MGEIQIYHNPRCSKSCCGLELIQSKGENIKVIEYLKHPLTTTEIEVLLEKLGIQPIELVRKNETLWKEQFKDKTLSETEIIHILSENPQLIERPIVVVGEKAVIARPPEKINELFL